MASLAAPFVRAALLVQPTRTVQGVLAIAYVVLLVVCALACAEMGQRCGRRRLRTTTPGASLETFVLGLLALLLAFTFSHSIDRFEGRRHAMVAESNDIGTVRLRLELLPGPARQRARRALRDYADTRLALFDRLLAQQPTRDVATQLRERSDELWTVAADATRDAPTPTNALVLPAINEMFDRGADRLVRLDDHPPLVVYVLLFVVTLCVTFITSYRPPNPEVPTDWMVRSLFAVVLGLIAYVIIDLEHPSRGLFRAEVIDGDLQALRAEIEAIAPADDARGVDAGQ